MKSFTSIGLALASGAAVMGVATATGVSAKSFDEWGAPAIIESLAGSSTEINSPAIDGCASLSADGLSLAFSSNRAGNHNLYLATRSSTDAGFGTPQLLPAPVNTSANDSCPTIATGHRIYFSSDREDPAYDIYMTRKGPKGWSAPVNLNVNRDGWLDETATFYEDEAGNEVMLFSSRLPSGLEGKIYQSFNGGPASLVAGGPHSSASDNRPSVTRNGLTIFFDSTRSGGLGGPDLYYATRTSTSQPFGTAVHLRSLSSPGFDARPFISKDGSILTLSSNRAGGESPAPDIWVTSR